MERKLRLTSATDFKRVRRFGKSFAHPLVVLIIQPNQLAISRFGVTAGKSIGEAVSRNRVRRRIREIIRTLISQIPTGWDIILIARSATIQAEYREIQTAIEELLREASLLQDQNVH
ncbi:MAG: ribonuclease P protein component [Chloroflexi bacterium]|nr:ribonuclease P protein component [Chloroflexota bacterium]